MTALAQQDFPYPFDVVVGLNNTTDRSAKLLASARDFHAHRFHLHIEEADFSPDKAHAGSARRLAMEAGRRRVGTGGILLSTDADCRPPVHWISANISALQSGQADIIGGRLVIDAQEALSPEVAACHRHWLAYWEAVRALEDEIDPCDWDPQPRHGDHTGASLALTAATYAAAGGVPPVAQAEDRALVRAVLKNGGRLAHPAQVWVRVSPRLNGRAKGGMADFMADMQARAAAGILPEAPALKQWADWFRRRHAMRLATPEADPRWRDDDWYSQAQHQLLDDGVIEALRAVS